MPSIKSGIDLCYEIHPGEDSMMEQLSKGSGKRRANIHVAISFMTQATFVLQQLDYLQYIDFYHQFIKMFHVKDAEFNPSGRSGVYGGYQDWVNRPGRFRSLGDWTG
jgi:sugar phosphate isomerase/epimerase